jgi:hypothetical protein
VKKNDQYHKWVESSPEDLATCHPWIGRVVAHTGSEQAAGIVGLYNCDPAKLALALDEE